MNLYSAEEAEKLAKVFEYRGPELDNIRDLMYHLRTEYLEPDADAERKAELKKKIAAEYDVFCMLFAAMQTQFNDYLNEAEAAINCAPDYFNELLNTICRK